MPLRTIDLAQIKRVAICGRTVVVTSAIGVARNFWHGACLQVSRLICLNYLTDICIEDKLLLSRSPGNHIPCLTTPLANGYLCEHWQFKCFRCLNLSKMKFIFISTLYRNYLFISYENRNNECMRVRRFPKTPNANFFSRLWKICISFPEFHLWFFVDRL